MQNEYNIHLQQENLNADYVEDLDCNADQHGRTMVNRQERVRKIRVWLCGIFGGWGFGFQTKRD